ncbi:hypothetical protein NFI96_023565, partial [Prochilodus magdalenae]
MLDSSNRFNEGEDLTWSMQHRMPPPPTDHGWLGFLLQNRIPSCLPEPGYVGAAAPPSPLSPHFPHHPPRKRATSGAERPRPPMACHLIMAAGQCRGPAPSFPIKTPTRCTRPPAQADGGRPEQREGGGAKALCRRSSASQRGQRLNQRGDVIAGTPGTGTGVPPVPGVDPQPGHPSESITGLISAPPHSRSRCAGTPVPRAALGHTFCLLQCPSVAPLAQILLPLARAMSIKQQGRHGGACSCPDGENAHWWAPNVPWGLHAGEDRHHLGWRRESKKGERPLI